MFQKTISNDVVRAKDVEILKEAIIEHYASTLFFPDKIDIIINNLLREKKISDILKNPSTKLTYNVDKDSAVISFEMSKGTDRYPKGVNRIIIDQQVLLESVEVRDAYRKNDLQLIYKALEDLYRKRGKYPIRTKWCEVTDCLLTRKDALFNYKLASQISPLIKSQFYIRENYFYSYKSDAQGKEFHLGTKLEADYASMKNDAPCNISDNYYNLCSR